MKARDLLGAMIEDGILVTISKNRVVLYGEPRVVEEAFSAMKEVSSLEAEVIALLRPSASKMTTWLTEQPESTRVEHRERIVRLREAGIGNPEGVALNSTYLDENHFLPHRLRPVQGAPPL